MSEPWQSPKYAPNSDVEPDARAAAESDDDATSGYGTPGHEPQPAAADPWNDPEDDDEEDDEVAQLKELSPDYLGVERPQESKKQGGSSAAWDALGDDDDDDDDETDDDIPAGITIGGRETKNAMGNGADPSPVGSDGGVSNHGENGLGDTEEASRKRQRESEDAQNKRQRTGVENGTGNAIDGRPDDTQTSYPASVNPTSAPSSGPPSTAVARNQQSHRPPHHPMPGLIMPSFFGITPRDDFVRIIGEWLLRVCAGRPGIEIEIKLGTLVDSRTRKRISLPSLSEMILPENFECSFISEMTERQHANLNQILNKEVEHCSGQAGPHPLLQPHTFYPISYKHTYTTDTFFPASQAAQEMGFPHAKRRMTRDDKTGRIVECLEKTKVANLNIFSPNEEFDWRVSVNMEVPAEVQPNERSAYERRKDRVSYKHHLYQVDLTQVNKPRGPHDKPPTHELEIEVLNAVDLLTQGWNESQNLPNTFEPQLLSLFNTARLLNRNAGPKYSQAPKRPQ